MATLLSIPRPLHDERRCVALSREAGTSYAWARDEHAGWLRRPRCAARRRISSLRHARSASSRRDLGGDRKSGHGGAILGGSMLELPSRISDVAVFRRGAVVTRT